MEGQATESVAAYFKGKGKGRLQVMFLLYFSQGLHLKFYREPLFEEEIFALKYFPVVNSVWDGWDSIQPNEQHPLQAFLDDVLSEFGSYSASDLCAFVRPKVPPWSIMGEKDPADLEEMVRWFTRKEIQETEKVAEKGKEDDNK